MYNLPKELTSLIKKENRKMIKGAMTSPTKADYIFAENLLLMGANMALEWKLKREKIENQKRLRGK